MQAGDLDRRITLQRSTSVAGALNEPIEQWSNLKKVWARRRDVSDGEKEASGQIGSTLVSRFVIRSSSVSRDFKTTDRLVHDGGIWNIQGIKQVDDGRDRFLEITAVRNADHGETDGSN